MSQMELAGAVFHAQGGFPEEISLLGSTCTQLMDSLVQHGRDVGWER